MASVRSLTWIGRVSEPPTSLFVQAPGWPLVELVDGAGRGGRLGSNDRLDRLLVREQSVIGS